MTCKKLELHFSRALKCLPITISEEKITGFEKPIIIKLAFVLRGHSRKRWRPPLKPKIIRLKYKATNQRFTAISRLSPLVFLPEIAGERDEQHGHEGSTADPDLQPQSEGLTRREASGRQGYTFGAQLWLVPHIQRFLERAADGEFPRFFLAQI